MNINQELKIGTEVTVKYCTTGHEFEIGDTVVFVDSDEYAMIFQNSKGVKWSMAEHEFDVLPTQKMIPVEELERIIADEWSGYNQLRDKLTDIINKYK